MTSPALTPDRTALLDAALAYAERGWPVFPCNAGNKRPLVASDRDDAGKPIKGTGGLRKASADPDQLRAWWARWPTAMIGVAVGRAGMLVVDFDPRVDGETGEEWTLERLKADLEAQMGCPLPVGLAVRTPSGGVHVYFRMPDGEPIGNRGNLPRHIDVRGLGGYVIVPPSVCRGDGKNAAGTYRWLRGDADAPIAELPEALVSILRSPPARAASVDRALPSREHVTRDTLAVDLNEAHRRYAMRALEDEVRELAVTPKGGGRYNGRNQGIYWAAFNLGQFVGAGALSSSIVRAALQDVVRGMPDNADLSSSLQTIENGLSNGIAKPRDLSAVGAQTARGRDSDRSSSSSSRDAQPVPPDAAYAADVAPRGADPPKSPAPVRSGAGAAEQSSQAGRVVHISAVEEAERVRLLAMAARWFDRRLEHVETSKQAITRLAFSAGMRVAAGLLDLAVVKEMLWAVYEGVADVQHADVDQAFDDGAARGFDLGPMLLTLTCSGYPLTDFGIAERFRDRFGADYRFTTAKGWLGWDQRRWKVLDQDEKTPPAEVIAAVYDTVRLIQDEARGIADTGVRRELVGEGKQQRLALEDANPHGLDRWVVKGAKFVLLSDLTRAFGRASETTGKPASVAALARRWLTVPIERFDHDAYSVNVLNGTLRFRVTEEDHKRKATVELAPHCRDDMQTKLSPVVYDPDALSPRYDRMFAWAQPEEPMRRYLHQLGGYTLTGDAGEQKLWYWYGRGRNGKGTTLDVWQHVTGDYSDAIPIGSFLDQGIKKRGDQASPDLAKLAGVRLLRSSEPGRNEKLDSGLIKLVTGGDPVPVRMLHRGFFNLKPLFKLIIMGNSRFDIPDTDDGIWSRLKLVPWLRNIEKPEPGVPDWPEKDPKLPAKIVAEEGSGVLNRLVAGLLDYMTHGLVEPVSVTEATSAYRDASDPLERFLRECVVSEDGATVQSSNLHAVFVAWAKAAGEREWTQKGFSNAMTEKGFTKHKSNGMHWLGMKLVRSVGDFVDAEGKVRELDKASLVDAHPPPTRSHAPPSAWDDDMPL